MERDLQSAILASFQTQRGPSQSNRPAAGSTSHSRRDSGSQRNSLGRLSRDGIMPASARATPGSRHGDATGSLSAALVDGSCPALDRTKLDHSCALSRQARRNGQERMSATARRASSAPASRASSPNSLLPSAPIAMSLGDDWWQLSEQSAGTFTRCGLQTVLESAGGRRFVCVWRPRDPALATAISGSNYNVEVSAKCARHSDAGRDQLSFHLVLFLKSTVDYYFISADAR